MVQKRVVTITFTIILLFLLSMNFISSMVCANDNEVTVFCSINSDNQQKVIVSNQIQESSNYNLMGIIVSISLLLILGGSYWIYKKMRKNGK